MGMLLTHACKKDDKEKDNIPEPNLPPACTITSPEDESEFTVGDTVEVQVTAADLDGTIVRVQFLINDIERFSDSTEPYQFTWYTSLESAGNYKVMARAYDNMETRRSYEINVVLNEASITIPPEADFLATPLTGVTPLEVSFTDLSLYEPTSWEWDFGDGGSSTNQNPSHIYDTAGVYTVSLTVSNEFGSDTKIITDLIDIIVPTGSSGTYTDPRDGQVYSTIEINGRVWFAENLNFAIENSWYYNDDSIQYEKYGRLYTWLAAAYACPEGWYLPTDEEWKKLELYLGMTYFETGQSGYRGKKEGEMLKSVSGWYEHGNGNNAAGFNALPGGARYNSWSYYDIEERGNWWTLTYYNWPEAWSRSLRYNDHKIGRFARLDSYGLSVRCFKSLN
jgi:uncharacterized protein (TIGR02145 family)